MPRKSTKDDSSKDFELLRVTGSTREVFVEPDNFCKVQWGGFPLGQFRSAYGLREIGFDDAAFDKYVSKNGVGSYPSHFCKEVEPNTSIRYPGIEVYLNWGAIGTKGYYGFVDALRVDTPHPEKYEAVQIGRIVVNEECDRFLEDVVYGQNGSHSYEDISKGVLAALKEVPWFWDALQLHMITLPQGIITDLTPKAFEYMEDSISNGVCIDIEPVLARKFVAAANTYGDRLRPLFNGKV
ncbi:MAG: hypothetical protein ACMXYE_05580 [Candidatus Woesearchaeota archaeon]